MSGVKRLLEDIMVMYLDGRSSLEISETLELDLETVEEVIEEYNDEWMGV